MDYKQREALKKKGWDDYRNGASRQTRQDGLLKVITAHHARVESAPNFDVYAGQWLNANKNEYDPQVTDQLRQQFPMCGPIRIKPSGSDWYPSGL